MIMKSRLLFILCFMSIAFVSIGLQKPISPNNDGFAHEVNKEFWVDSIAQGLTTEQKIAQFFMPAVYSSKGEDHKEEILQLIDRYQIGGVIFFKGSPTKQATWANEFQAASPTPLFVSIDGEWGVNMRLDNTVKYPRQLTLGAIRDESIIYKMGQRIAKECLAVGVNINLAPVMDVNNNPDNPVINDRSFGEDKLNVAIKSLAYAEGMQSKGVMAVGKHFPGHGDTDKDSHLTLPVINHDIARLNDIELYPFKVAFENGLMGVMAAHLFIPALDNTPNRAVSLSPKVITELLRDSLGFKGLVFSDALNMQGVTDFYEKGEVDLAAFLAGNDILLFSEDIDKGISLIKAALDNGEITEDYLDARLKKVLSYKYELGLFKRDTTSLIGIESYLQNRTALKLQKRLFEEATTLALNNDNFFPITTDLSVRMASLSIGTNEITGFQDYVSGYREVTNFVAPVELSQTTVDNLVKNLAVYDEVLISVFGMSRWSSKNYGFSATELDLLKRINEQSKVGLVLFGSPYSLSLFDEFDNVLVAYEENDVTNMTAANAVIGATSFNGMLPVSAGKFSFGDGIEYIAENRMEYEIPQVLRNSLFLKNIDNLARKAVDIGATPGCQVLVAKDGKIVFNKSYGYTTYDNITPIDNQSIYDIASITKVAATTLSIMKLYEQGLVDLKKPLKDYLFGYDDVAVGNLIIEDVLAHQSGLPAWIPFYAYTLADSISNQWYQPDSSEQFCIRVADDLYICQDSAETIWKTISGVTIKEDPKYRYSDIGFYLLKSLVEQVSGTPFDRYVAENFYDPMGLQRMTFHPMNRFDKVRIVPTEDDQIFRKQVIQGYVHDPGAAMLGGVSGHAGLFSNATDLAVVMQMLLNGGNYGGKQILEPETVNHFVTAHFADNDNRRGLGFDKPVLLNELGRREGGPTSEKVSPYTFGHTGFTGTAAWADPEHGLVYIFLSNRVYPEASNKKLLHENIRTDIQAEIYKCIGIFED